MNSEIFRIPSNEPHLDTPETLQECLNLSAMVCDQVEVWGSRLRSPVMRRHSMTKYILEECEPLGRDPIDYTLEAGFGSIRSREDAAFMTEYEKRREVVAKWAHAEALDDIEMRHQGFEEYYDRISTFTQNPSTPPEFTDALTSIRRLYVLCEHLAYETGKEQDFDGSTFVALAMRVTEELY